MGIPSAEKFWKNFQNYDPDENQLKAMIEFAKLHVEAALKAASENAILIIDGITEKSNGQKYIVEEGNHYSETEIDISKDSILNTYPLENIK